MHASFFSNYLLYPFCRHTQESAGELGEVHFGHALTLLYRWHGDVVAPPYVVGGICKNQAQMIVKHDQRTFSFENYNLLIFRDHDTKMQTLRVWGVFLNKKQDHTVFLLLQT